MDYIDKKIAKRFEKAITFLVEHINNSGTNPKPAILHSLQVAFLLHDKGYGPNIIESAILHDTVEDSDVTFDELEHVFGTEVRNLVESVSYDESITNWIKKYKDMFSRIKTAGRNALILKSADIYCNSFYIRLVEEIELQDKLVDKIKNFLTISKSIKNEQIWIDLENRYNEEHKRLNSLEKQ